MQNRIVIAIKEAKKSHKTDFHTYARTAVKAILAEFDVPEHEHEGWLDAID